MSNETISVSSILPSHIRDAQTPLIGFIEEYYHYLSTEGLPSNIVRNIASSRDIDAVSDSYLSSIAAEIAKTIPASSAIDKRSLYKKIVAYYSTRGNEDSVVVFFRIFFNEIVNISYPKEQIIKTSVSGHHVSSIDWKMQDGEFYQEFSYLIKTGLPFQDWEHLFSRIVHPAGLKLFAEIALYLSVRNPFTSWLDTRVGSNIYESIRLPSHSPTIQPGWINDALRNLLFVLYGERPVEDDHVRALYIVLTFISDYNDGGHERLVHENYENVKFFDSTEISAYLSMNPFSAPYIERRPLFVELYSNVGTIIEVGPSDPQPVRAYFRNLSGKDDDTRLVLNGTIIYDPQRTLGADDLVTIELADGLSNGARLQVYVYDKDPVWKSFFLWELVVFWPSGVAARYTGGTGLSEPSTTTPAYYENGECTIEYPSSSDTFWVNSAQTITLNVNPCRLNYTCYPTLGYNAGWSIYEDAVELDYGEFLSPNYNTFMYEFTEATTVDLQVRDLATTDYVVIYKTELLSGPTEIEAVSGFDELLEGPASSIGVSEWPNPLTIEYYGNDFGADNMDSYSIGAISLLDSSSNWSIWSAPITELGVVPAIENLDSYSNGSVTSVGEYTISTWSA